jgi:hypothetical protein
MANCAAKSGNLTICTTLSVAENTASRVKIGLGGKIGPWRDRLSG